MTGTVPGLPYVAPAVTPLVLPTPVSTTAPTAPGQYATLVDARTLLVGVMQSVNNTSAFYRGIKDNTGTQLGWVRPYESASVELLDNSTQAGIWAVSNASKIALTAHNAVINTTSYFGNGTTPILKTLAIDANRTLLCFYRQDANGPVYGIMYDSSQPAGSQWGNPTQMVASAQQVALALQATNQVLLVTGDASSTVSAIIIGLSGLTITPGSSGSRAAGGALTGSNAYFQLVSLTASAYVIGFGRATNTAGFMAITISGATITAVGVEAALATSAASGQGNFMFKSSSTVLRTIVAGSSTTGYIQPYTLSGSTLTPGTQATFTHVAAGDSASRAFVNGNGNIMLMVPGNNNVYVSSLSGTVETVTSASLGGAFSASSSAIECTYIAPNKVCILGKISTGNYNCNIATDTAGTASAGTQITQDVPSPMADISHVLAFPLVGTTASFAMDPQTAGNGLLVVSINTSGASPVFLDQNYFYMATSFGSSLKTADRSGVRSPYTLSAGNYLYSIDPVNNGASGVRMGVNDFKFIHEYVNPMNIATANAATVGVGTAANDSWILKTTDGNGGIYQGLIFDKVEAVA